MACSDRNTCLTILASVCKQERRDYALVSVVPCVCAGRERTQRGADAQRARVIELRVRRRVADG